MKRLFLFLVLFLIMGNCFCAELLVRAKSHWMDNLTQAEIGLLIADKKITQESYNARSQIGDVIVVRPDGWQWGKEECLPNYIVIQIPDLKYEDAKKYEESLQDISDLKNPKMLKLRKYQISQSVIDNAKVQKKSIIEVKKLDQNTFISNIIEKTK